MACKDDDGFDLIQPSLIQQLKSILDQYPDDGQILKELIQNAEDANASRVKFLHDKHSHDTEQLFDEDLAQFQGPALYAYNNARFTKEDWRGIRLVCDSIKVEDPMKVGRFGLGFKSVFHMTDLPSLLSDCQIGFIDPHGIHFSDKRHRRTGKHWRLNEDRTEMEEIPDQFVPYKGIFDCTEDVFSRGFYDGTLFRFPFRTKTSELSATLYSAEKMDTLFESFEANAHFVLLFLQHLESIELYVREESESNPEMVFQVKIDDQCLQIVRAKRKEFLAKITPGKVITESVTVTYPVKIETEKFCHGTVKQQYSFLVTNYFCGWEVSTRFKRLITDKELNYLPTVGVAMALPTGPKLQTPDIKGHVFCFLPLPVQKKSLTGLPVHVNGFFALSQNRRYIKSPNADQEDRECTGRHLTDKSLLWNKCLLEEAIPRAYATMILEAINEKSYSVPRTSIFKAWPDISSIDPKWEKIENPLFTLLLQEKVVYTQVHFGQWLTVDKAVFDQLSEDEPRELLQRVLLEGGVSIVSVPSHVTDGITSHAATTVNTITPSLTRATLKKHAQCYKKLVRREKLLLLQFCLKDCKFEKLCNLKLLPLSDGSFTTFSVRGEQIYICSPEHPRELFPGLQHRFIDDTVNGDIIDKLKDAADQEVTQLRLLCEDDVPFLLYETVPAEWNKGDTVSWYPDVSNHNHPPREWITVVWRYLHEHFTTEEDIQRLGQLPLIPLSMTQTPVTLARLSHPSRVVVKRLYDDCLGETLTNVLRKLGLIVMNEFPDYVRNHPAILGAFVHPPSPQGVLKAMVISSGQMAAGKFSEIVRTILSTNEKYLLRSFLTRLRRAYLRSAEYSLLCTLPIFQTLCKKFVSKKEGLCAVVAGSLPVAPLRELIDITQHDSKTLAVLLDVKILTSTELLCQMVFPDIQRGKYSGDQIDKLMTYVLENHTSEIRKNVTFKQKLQELAFVSKQRGRARASDLFSPRDVVLKNLFVNEDVFPTVPYNERSLLVMLEELGMKSEENITGYDLYQSAKLVNGLTYLPTAERKSKAVLEFLRDNPKALSESVYGQPLGSLLKDIPWVSRLQERPPNYPAGLTWFEDGEKNGKHFFKPTEVKSQDLANLVGTVMPLVEVQPSNLISEYFGWQYLPGVFQVIQQLQNVIRSYSKEEKPLFMVVVNEIYYMLSRLLAMDVDVGRAFDSLEEFDWVWNGNGFSSPSHVLFREPQIDLTPYIRSLPTDMAKYAELFYRFGMRERSYPVVLVQVLHMIKEKYDEGIALSNALEAKRDLQLSINILNELACEQLSEELQAQIVFPTYSEDNSQVVLKPVEFCMFGHQEWLMREGDDEDLDYFYVHPSVPNSTAERLGVPSLTNRMLDPDELSIGEEFGQEEKLTIRLNRLLEEYTDGFSVLKELVQNADDAGATEVRFLYDERTNEDAMTCLIDEGMKGCQGPSLWVYNDAEFKDEDFDNIAKLNEATKEHDTEKIGRFGLGFNAVYNLTDVPMILSRNYFVIFDPHTSYLGKAIKDKRKPGMRINLNKEVKKLCKFANQFKPFNDIFGCDLHLSKEDNSFNGTLFRFPLRTQEQALRSEIKKLNYDDAEMRELLQMLIDRSESLLLFTQNVLRVEIYSLPRKTSQHSLPALLFQVSKSMPHEGILRELCFPVTLPVTAKKLNAGQQRFLSQCCFLQASSKVAREARYHRVHPSEFPESSILVDIDCSFTKLGLSFFNGHEYLWQERLTWLVASAMGKGQAMQFAEKDESLLPSGGAAVRLVPTGNSKFLPLPANVDRDEPTLNNSIIFCYLPLPMHSGLPLHINGAFAVAANRRHLQSKVEDDKRCYGFDWNKVLMQDSILCAYFSLLEDIKSIAPDDGSYKFHSLWPKAGEVHGDCWPILQSFYEQLAFGDHALFSVDGSTWVGMQQVVFLDPGFRLEPQIGDTSFAVFQTLAKEVVIDLPADVFQSFKDCGLWQEIQTRTYDKGRFFHEVFFPNISRVRSDLRDVLVLHVLDTNNQDFHGLIKTRACIPVSPCGQSLKCPSQLVNPYREVSSLFCPEDCKFPCGTDETFHNHHRLAKLEQLGMSSNDLPWKEIAERAESIDRLNAVDCKAAVKRVKVLLSFIQKKIKGKGEGPSEPVTKRLVEAKFLPVLQKPENFPLSWKGDEFQSRRNGLVAAKDAFLMEKKYLVCCTEPLVDLEIPKKVTELLKLRNKDVSIQHVMSQLEEAICIEIDSLDREGYEEVNRVCTEAYSFLQKTMTSYSTEIKEFLVDKKFILVGKRFLAADQVALEINADCSPYLYKLPEHLANSCSVIMKLAGVKEKFEEKDFIASLQRVERQFHDRQLDEETLEVTVHMAYQLGDTLERLNRDCSRIPDSWGIIYLPSSTREMRPASQLCMKDCPWISDNDDESIQFVSDKIAWATCSLLGVKTRTEEALQHHDYGIPFGQQEKLTTRLKRILTGYPCEKDILKELLQNADDAQATEICFIKDPRYHPDEKVPKECWKPLQGPALCVYNNKPFTNADIKGIQTLGEGSKGDDPNKTGQYGVGFNAVYHLTDVPSFRSRGEEIGDVLCVFDPHCKYVPNATDKEPGRKYKDIKKMERKFSDVFSCYLEDRFPIQNSTMFRLPLRTEEMAHISQISSDAVTVKKLDEMMEDLKTELLDVLLFVNNVKKISLCGIDESSGKLTDIYSVEVLLSEGDDRKRQAFADCIKEIGNDLKESRSSLPTSVKVKKCMYTMKLRDTSGREETWLIVQQVGFEQAVDKSILDAFSNQKLGMIPRGGVACLLESTNSREQLRRKKKAYCFLPLPLETDLPVHINGHFALDHEAR